MSYGTLPEKVQALAGKGQSSVMTEYEKGQSSVMTEYELPGKIQTSIMAEPERRGSEPSLRPAFFQK